MSQLFKIINKISKDVNLLLKKTNNTKRFFHQKQKIVVEEPTRIKIKPSNESKNGSEVPKLYFLKTTLAAIGFTGFCFTGCSILYYENVLTKSSIEKSKKQFSFRSQINDFWNNQTKFQKFVLGIIGINVSVFIAWRIPLLANIMQKYFLSYPKKEAMFSSLLLASFSHISFIHLLFNMTALYSLTTPLEKLLGAEQFLAFYLTSGFISSYLSNNFKLLTTVLRPSVGASGALLACFAAISLAYPKAKFAFIFFPIISFQAEDLLLGVIAFDIIGLFLRKLNLDHMGHLAGTFFGIWYYKYGHMYLWESQKKVIKKWHEYRSKK